MSPKGTKSARKSRSKPTRKQNSTASRKRPAKSAAYEDLFVVGIGASAGGLEALRSLVQHLPPLDNVAYIVAQHLDPTHRSVLGELLARDIALELVEVKHNDWIRPKAVFITPVNRHIAIANGRFKLIKPTTSFGPKPSVDYFFTSLAEEKGEKAVGIILSGTGSDGAHGVRAIKAEGGVTIVQDLRTAKYNEMPQAAMNTGHVDLILPPEKIGPELASIIEFPRLVKKVFPADDAPFNLRRLLGMLHERVGCDFSEYKRATINRRIERRMALHKIDSLKDYIRHLEATPQELDGLYKDIFIAVTSFFRDPEAFDVLSKYIAEIVKGKKPGDSIRFWIPGCATGEEAYSVAILLSQALNDQVDRYNVQIFATDLDAEAIEVARKAIYPQATVVDIDQRILDCYFKADDNLFQVNKSIREMLIFAKQNLIDDPPFSRLDLIVCRNVLIYFNSRLQNRLLSMFHYVLNEAGYLFLGKSESVGQLGNLFSPVDRKWKVYKRRETFRKQHVDFGAGQAATYRAASYKKPEGPKKETHLKDLTNQAIAHAYGPKAVVLDDRLEVVFVRGDVTPYLRLPAGEAGLNVLDLARHDIRMELRRLIHTATREGMPVHGKKLQLTDGDTVRLVSILVTPISSAETTQGLALVAFEEETTKAPDLPAPDTVEEGDLDPRVRELEQELATTREYLQTTVEELDTTNEELQSTNEELQSANEELHSSNEELQTANEELQSTNEELLTVNQELQVRSAELQEAREYDENIVDTVREPLVVLDKDLRVISANRSFYQTFQVTPQETENKYFYDLGNRQWDIPSLRQLLERTPPKSGRFSDFEVEREFPTIGRRTMLLNGRQIFREGHETEMILLAIEDITERKRAQEALRKSEERLAEAQRIAHIGSWEWDLIRDEVVWSAEQYRIFGVERKQFTPSFKSFLKRVHPDDRESVKEHVEATIFQNRPYAVDYRIVLPGGSIRFIHSAAKLERNVDGQAVRFIGTAQDVTESHDLSAQLAYQASHDALTGLINRREFERRLQRVLESASAGGSEHALCYLDLDQFKVINDACGHVAGDELLRQLAGLLNERVRKRDTLARLGGDEFGVLLEHCSLKQARRVANGLCKAIADFRFVWEDQSFSIGVSIGLVPITKDSESKTDILKDADSACYAAKDEGRNRIHVYRAGDAELARRHGEMQWVARIQRGLEEDRLHLDVQPITPVTAKESKGRHYELLLRMEDEEGQIVPPGVFLAAAERYDLSTKLDHWVIDTAFKWLTGHPEQLDRLFLCSTNLSGRSLGDKEFLEFVIRQFSETNVPPEKICFEITETTAITNLASAARFVKVLKQRGCRFALDDFGSGLSSFAYLKNLPVDFLKIDGMFVKNIVDDRTDWAMVKSINEIGHVMGKQTIAEFVENESILEKLREIGVDYAQGYGVGRPKPLNEML